MVHASAAEASSRAAIADWAACCVASLSLDVGLGPNGFQSARADHLELSHDGQGLRVVQGGQRGLCRLAGGDRFPRPELGEGQGPLALGLFHSRSLSGIGGERGQRFQCPDVGAPIDSGNPLNGGRRMGDDLGVGMLEEVHLNLGQSADPLQTAGPEVEHRLCLLMSQEGGRAGVGPHGDPIRAQPGHPPIDRLKRERGVVGRGRLKRLADCGAPSFIPDSRKGAWVRYTQLRPMEDGGRRGDREPEGQRTDQHASGGDHRPPGQRLEERLHRGPSLLGIRVQAALQDGLNPRRNPPHRMVEARRMSAGQGFAKGEAEAVDVGAAGRFAPLSLLGCHVGGRPGDAACTGERAQIRGGYELLALGLSLRGGPRQAKVGHADAAIRAHQHVLGLEVAVDQAGGLRGRQPLSRLQNDAHDLAHGVGLAHPRPQSGPLDQLHRQEQLAIERPHIVNGDHMGVGDLGERPRLPLQPGLRQVNVFIGIGREELERYLAVELAIEGGVDHAHAPGSQRREQDVAIDRGLRGALARFPIVRKVCQQPRQARHASMCSRIAPRIPSDRVDSMSPCRVSSLRQVGSI